MDFDPLDPLGLFGTTRGPTLSSMARDVEKFGEMHYLVVYDGKRLIDWDGHHTGEAMRLRLGQMRDKYPNATFRRLRLIKEV